MGRYLRDLEQEQDLDPAPQATRVRAYPLGFPSGCITHAGTLTFETSPMLAFRGKRLVLGELERIKHLVVRRIIVGQCEQIISIPPSGIQGAAFAAEAYPLRLALDTAQVSQRIRIEVENRGQDLVELTPVLLGLAVE